MLMHVRRRVMEEYVVVGSSLMGAHCGPSYMCVVGLPACGLPVVYLIVIGWLMLGSRVVLPLLSLLC